MILESLQNSTVGRAIYQRSAVFDPVTYVIRPRRLLSIVEQVGVDKMVACLLVRSAMLNIPPHRLLMYDDRCQGIIDLIESDRFYTRFPINRLRDRWPGLSMDQILPLFNMEITSILVDEFGPDYVQTFRRPDAYPDYGRIQRVLASTALLRQIPGSGPTDTDTEDPYIDWFVMGRARDDAYVTGVMLNRLTGHIRDNLKYVSRIRLFSCIQEVSHLHGLIRTKVAMTQRWVNSVIRTPYYDLDVEPVKKNTRACEFYIMSQATAAHAEHINFDVYESRILGACRPISQLSAEELHFLTPLHTAEEWRKAVNHSIEMGMPWYAVKKHSRFMGRTVRATLRAKSTRISNMRVRDWDIEVFPINDRDLAGHVARYYGIFGAGCVYDWDLGQLEWSGQPVILVHNDTQLGRVQSMYDHRRGLVVTVLKSS